MVLSDLGLAQPADVRRRAQELARTLDQGSRYLGDLLALLDASRDVPDFEQRLAKESRGARHSGAEVFASMSLEQKLLANLITPETSLFRFSEGELEALDRQLLPMIRGRKARVLIVPCSHGEEAFTIAAYFLKLGVDFGISAFDIQPALIAEAQTGRLSFGYPSEHLAQAGRVSERVLAHIDFAVGDAFALPLPPTERFDVVLCRNFVGYFEPSTAARLVDQLALRVAPDGVLFLDGFCVSKLPVLLDRLSALGARQLYGRPVFQLPGGAAR